MPADGRLDLTRR